MFSVGHCACPHLVPVHELFSAYAGNKQMWDAKVCPHLPRDLYYHYAAFSAKTLWEAEFCLLLRQPTELITTGMNCIHWRLQESGKIPGKTGRVSALPPLTHPVLHTGNVTSVRLWMAQRGNWTEAGMDRQKRGSRACRVTENSPSAFIKNMLSS